MNLDHRVYDLSIIHLNCKNNNRSSSPSTKFTSSKKYDNFHCKGLHMLKLSLVTLVAPRKLVWHVSHDLSSPDREDQILVCHFQKSS